MEKQVQTELWSKQDTDMGLVKSANPVSIGLKPGACLQQKWQSQLHHDAEQSIQPTTEGLIQARVLVETFTYCNAPIFLLLNQISQNGIWYMMTWAVNQLIQDWPAEVPNLHMLLTNAPPDAKYFTMIDHCSAFLAFLWLMRAGICLPSRMLVNNIHIPGYHKILNIHCLCLIRFLRLTLKTSSWKARCCSRSMIFYFVSCHSNNATEILLRY